MRYKVMLDLAFETLAKAKEVFDIAKTKKNKVKKRVKIK